MATGAMSSHGTLLKVGDGTTPTEVFTTVSEVLDISGPSTALSLEDATSHDSSGWRENIPTLLEGGEVTFDINYVKHATQTGLRTDMENSTLRNFQVVFGSPVSETLDFAAYVTAFEYSAPVEGILRASLTLSIQGAITAS